MNISKEENVMGKMLKGFGLPKILGFLFKGKKREKQIRQATEIVKPASPTNLKAKALHPKGLLGTVKEATLRQGILFVTFDVPNFPYFRAGQYLTISFQEGQAIYSRPISILSSPKQAAQGQVYVAIKTNEQGEFSRLASTYLTVGATVSLSAPSGDFYYSPNRDQKQVIACIGGVGATPIVSMAGAILEGSEDFSLTIIYGAKSIDEAVFLPLFMEYQKRDPRIRVRFLDESKGRRFTKEVILEEADGQEFSLFVCGPQGMYQAFDGIAKELGLDRKHYRRELFGGIKDPAYFPDYPGAKQSSFHAKIFMVDQVYEVEIPANRPILASLESLGIASPHRCRGGICGACRGHILAGEVYIPNFEDGRRLSDKEKGYAHLCMAFPLSDLEIEIPAP